MFYQRELNYPIPSHPSWDKVDPTKIKGYMECPRKFFYSYLLGWQPQKESIHLIFGSAWHEAMKILYESDFSAENVMRAYREGFLPSYREHVDPGEDELYLPKTPARAFVALAYYASFHRNEFSKAQVLEYDGKKLVEIGGSVSVSDEYSVCFRQDVIMKDHRGIFSLEHKTTSSLYGWKEQWALNPATAVYTHVLYCLFPAAEVSGIVYNGVLFRKTKDDPKKDLADPFRHVECDRATIYKPLQTIGAMLVNIIGWLDFIKSDIELLAEAKDSDTYLSCFAQNWTSCMNWGRTCEYWDFCNYWRNPLRNIDRLPMDMEVRFWDPTEEPVNVKLAL